MTDSRDMRSWEARRSAAVAAHFHQPSYYHATSEAWKAIGRADPPLYWHTAMMMAEHLEAALRHLPRKIEFSRKLAADARAEVERLKPKPSLRLVFGRRQAEPTPLLKQAEENLKRRLEQVQVREDQSERFAAFVAEIGAWVGGCDPWARLGPGDVEKLRRAHERCRNEFKDLVFFDFPSDFADLEKETLIAMMTGDERAISALSADMRDYVNGHYLLPKRGWHQMFGEGTSIQHQARAANADRLMLLQLVYDDMIKWRFGDMGAMQFWIPAEDLAARRWEAMTMTFESH